MSESAKVVNYTEEMVATITSEYEANPVRSTVDSLAKRFDKSPRSVIAKLSPLGNYQAPARGLGDVYKRQLLILHPLQ